MRPPEPAFKRLQESSKRAVLHHISEQAGAGPVEEALECALGLIV